MPFKCNIRRHQLMHQLISHTRIFATHIFHSLHFHWAQPRDGRISIKKTTWAFLLLLTLNYDAVPRSAITLQREALSMLPLSLSLYIALKMYPCKRTRMNTWENVHLTVGEEANQSRALRMTQSTKYGMCQHFGTWAKGKRLGYWLRPFYAKL